MTDYPARVARLQKIRTNLAAKSARGDVNAAKVLKRLEPLDTLGDVDFDAVIIPEYGPRLKSAASMFGYYDVFRRKSNFSVPQFGKTPVSTGKQPCSAVGIRPCRVLTALISQTNITNISATARVRCILLPMTALRWLRHYPDRTAAA